MADNAVVITDEGFQSQVIDSATPVLVDFSAEWCGPCKMMAPIIEELADEYAGRVAVGKVDVENSRDSAAKYGIQNVPTIMVFQGGEPVKKFVGLIPKTKLAEALDEVLQAG